ncbi:mucin-5AC [Gouania willdenowi]|uniref:mucin-5AC n=1 Tax=Gouania willdenowi TaxID=441366 RepID=UPI001055CD52|nr:mucin-5AC-like [Gouania willdenowi]
MSTSDAAELELRAGGGGGGPAAAPPYAHTTRTVTTATREHHDEASGEKPTNRHHDETQRSTVRQEQTHKASTLRADEASHHNDRRSHELRFTTSLLLRLSNSLGLARANLKSKSISEQRPPRLIETQKPKTKDSPDETSCQTSIAKTNTSLSGTLSSSSTANKKNQVTPGVSEEQEIINIEPHKHQSGNQPETCTYFTEKPSTENFKDQTELGRHSDLSGQMLSSTVVTVLAPHWGSRSRRPKKGDGPGCSGAHWNLQEPNSDPVFHGVKDLFTSGSQDTVRVPSPGPRSNSVSWSTKSEPVSLVPRRKITQTTSLESRSGRMDNQKRDARAPSSARPPFLPHDEQKGASQKSHQAHLSSSSSKPTTSSLLLSLRRFNSDGRSPPPLNSSSDQNGKLFSPHLSQSVRNKNEQERSKSFLSPTSTAYSSPDAQTFLSPPFNDQMQWTPSNTIFFPTSPMEKDAVERPFTQHGQRINKTQSSFSFHNSTNKEMTIGQNNGIPHLHTETSISSPKHASYNHNYSQKTVPRATLTSTSWWKQVTHEGSRNVTKNSTDAPNTPFIQKHLDDRDMAYLNSTDNKGLGSQIPSNSDNSNTVESLYEVNMNLGMQIHRGNPDLKQRDAKYFPGQDSDRMMTLSNCSNLKSRNTPKPQSMPDVLYSQKINRAPLQSVQMHCVDPQKHEINHRPYTTQTNEVPVNYLNPRSPNPRSPNTVTDNVNSSNQCKPISPITPIATHKFMRLSSFHDFTNTPNRQVFSPVPNTNTNLSSQFPPSSPQVAPQTSHTSTSSQTRKSPEITNTSPLGFERSYASIPKPSQAKIMSSLMSTLTSSPQAKYSSLPTSSTTSLGTTNNHLVSNNPTSTALATGSLTPVNVSYFLTPPTTPVVTNSEMSTLTGRKTYSNSLERQPKKRQETEVKKARRVTWHDSVEVKCPEPIKKENSFVTPSKSVQSTQSDFTSLKPNNPNIDTSIFSLKSSKLPEEKGGKLRSLSSDFADLVSRKNESKKQGLGDSVSFDQQRLDLTNQEIQPEESDTFQTRSHAPLSLPPDLSRSYQHRYSSPPYSTLMSTRLAHGEFKTLPPRSPRFSQSPQSNRTQLISLKTDIIAAKPNVRTLSSTSPSQPSSLPLQIQAATKVNEKCVISERVNLGPQSQQNNTVHDPSPSYISATKSKVNTDITQPLDSLENTAVSIKTYQFKKTADEPHGLSEHNFNVSLSTDRPPQAGERKKDCHIGKSKFLSLNNNPEPSPKKSWFSLKKSLSTPNASSVRSESERASKSGKMDQVFNKLKQKLSIRQSEDEPSYPRKCRRSSETPSVGGISDISNFSDISNDSTKTLEERVQEKENDPNGGRKDEEGTDRWAQNRYTITPFSSTGRIAPSDSFSSPCLETAAFEDNITENPGQHNLRVHSPIIIEADFSKDKRTPEIQCLPSSPCRSPDPSADYASQHRKSTPSPRSPFSPFGSLSPHSPLSLTDASDDVFFSPKLNRRKETSSPQPAEGLCLTGSRKHRASTGPPSIDPGQNSDCLESLYADLKYGIEPGRTFSVSSVLSSRPSGPGRISTGSRFMSVGDLSQPNTFSKGQWKVTQDGTTEVDGQPSTDQNSYFLGDLGEMRSRSLPRSLSRCLANWSSDITKPTDLQGANRSFELDTEDPLTPHPTPPNSPISRRMSKPPSPTLSSSSGSPQSADSPSSRGRLPSHGYVSSLSTFKESSDSSSDTTTDDEYYLDSDDEGEKETEL